MDNTEKLKNISIAVSTLFIPILLGFVGHEYTKKISEREIQGTFVELGVRILEQEPTEENQNLRKWAVDVLNNYSGVPINESAQKELLELPITYVDPGASEVTIGPGQGFRFSSFVYSLGECNVDETVVACDFQIEAPARNIELSLRPQSLSKTVARVVMEFGAFKLAFHHGPRISQALALTPGSVNKGRIVFQLQGAQLQNQADVFENLEFAFEVQPTSGKRIIITIKPA